MSQRDKMERYYRYHSKIYDMTRWSFLFGRQRIIKNVAQFSAPKRILEIGCGTGKNLAYMAKMFPHTRITGIDISESMLEVAEGNTGKYASRVDLEHYNYKKPVEKNSFDMILLSYCLSMINPGWRNVLQCAYQDLSDNGVIAVVDFHDSRLTSFKKWVGINHVRMEGHLLIELESNFNAICRDVNLAYGGVWEYMMFIGSKKIITGLDFDNPR